MIDGVSQSLQGSMTLQVVSPTLTPFQPQLSHSADSDSFTYFYDLVSGSFIVIQNNIYSPNNVLEMSHLSPHSSHSQIGNIFPPMIISPNTYDCNSGATQSLTCNTDSSPTLGGGTTINSLTTITPHTVDVSPTTTPVPVPSVIATPSSPMLTNTLTLQDASPLSSSGDSDTSLGCGLEEINTEELTHRISAELRRYNIPQVIFAKRVLGRSQGTLSDLLCYPKPWSKLSERGREIFWEMWKWLQEPESQKISLGRARESIVGEAHPKDCNGEPVAAQILQRGKRKDKLQIQPKHMLKPKKRRFVFTDLQRRTLRNIFNQTNMPTKQFKETIALELGLEVTTVCNFFENARRRSYKWKDNPLSTTVTQQHGLVVEEYEPPSSTHCVSVNRRDSMEGTSSLSEVKS